MTTTLTYGATTLTLPDDLQWPDEFAWVPVSSTQSYSAGGALLINRGVKLSGRPITLQGGPTWAWMDRTTALTLLEWAGVAGAALTLSYRSVSYSVKFAPVDAPLDVTPVVDYADPEGTDFYYATLRFITVS